ncbi:hypothetical protein [Okeania sp. SIO2C2]|uniref:hypothetical protein n=1 Tax=Okeania sp. SIO2C2 TaxID=2607787 RepID=UPI00257F317B|nr:hypothetical protein [Okeania sp. SIO2C2]
MRRRVIIARDAKEGSQRQLAARFKISLSFVRNLWRHDRHYGQIEAKGRGGDQQPIISHDHLNIIKSLVEEKNDLLLRELSKRYQSRTALLHESSGRKKLP